MNQCIKKDIKAMTLLDNIKKLEFGDNFTWAYASGRLPLELEFDVMHFIGAIIIGEAIGIMSRADRLLKAYKYNPIKAREAIKLTKKIDTLWNCRH